MPGAAAAASAPVPARPADRALASDEQERARRSPWLAQSAIAEAAPRHKSRSAVSAVLRSRNSPTSRPRRVVGPSVVEVLGTDYRVAQLQGSRLSALPSASETRKFRESKSPVVPVQRQTASSTNARERADGQRVAVLPATTIRASSPGRAQTSCDPRWRITLPASFLQRRTNFSVLLGHGPRLGAAPNSRTSGQPESSSVCTTFGPEGARMRPEYGHERPRNSCQSASTATKSLQSAMPEEGLEPPTRGL
jgi:hypothetical protein